MSNVRPLYPDTEEIESLMREFYGLIRRLARLGFYPTEAKELRAALERYETRLTSATRRAERMER